MNTFERCDCCDKFYIRVEPKVIEVPQGAILHARVGVLDLGDGQGPWIPSDDELEYVREALDSCLPSVKGAVVESIVTHIGVDLTVDEDADTVAE